MSPSRSKSRSLKCPLRPSVIWPPPSICVCVCLSVYVRIQFFLFLAVCVVKTFVSSFLSVQEFICEDFHPIFSSTSWLIFFFKFSYSKCTFLWYTVMLVLTNAWSAVSTRTFLCKSSFSHATLYRQSSPSSSPQSVFLFIVLTSLASYK